MKRGGLVRVRAYGSSDEWTTARVAMISENGRSVVLWLDGPVRAGSGAFILGVLPLCIDYENQTVTSLGFGHEYEIEVQAEPYE